MSIRRPERESEQESIRRHYENAYQTDGAATRHGEWRRITGATKVGHIIRLATAAELNPTTVADVGCGDGTVLAQLASIGFGTRRVGYEIAEAAVALATQAPGIDDVELFDGRRVPAADGSFDLVIASHVLEH